MSPISQDFATRVRAPHLIAVCNLMEEGSIKYVVSERKGTCWLLLVPHY